LRVDLFLKLMGIVKTRMAAKHLCDSGKVLRGGAPLKPSHQVLSGDVLELFLPRKEFRMKVLEVPPTHSVAKKDRLLYMGLLDIKEI